MDENTNKFAHPQSEPLFMAIPKTDAAFQSAYGRAAASVPQFIEHIQRSEDSLPKQVGTFLGFLTA